LRLVVMEAPSDTQTQPGAVTIRCGRRSLSGRLCQARLFEVFYFGERPLVRANPKMTEHIGIYIGPGQMLRSDQRWKLRHRCWSGKPIVTHGFVCSISQAARGRGRGAIDLAEQL